MKTARRAFRALLRSPLRAGLLVAVLGVAMGLSLIMITVNGAFAERLDDIRAQVGTTITVTPAGSFGGGFIIRGGIGPGGDGTEQRDQTTDDSAAQPTLTDDDLDALSSIEHVASYSKRITSQYSGDELESTTIQPPAGVQLPPGAPAGGFQVPILVTGTDNPNSLITLGVQNATIVDGRTFNSDETEANVAVVGQSLAENNELTVGDTFHLNGTTMEVVGIYTTGTQFGDNSLFLPLETARTVFDRAGEVDEVTVQADTAANVASVATAIREALGEDVADVATQENLFDAISAPVSDAESSSRVAMIAALAASAAVILFSVVLVVRQRIKEIGIFKAIGASNWQVTLQFGLETAVISVVAAVLGAAATFPLAQTVANGLVSDSSSGTGPDGGPVLSGPGGGAGPIGARFEQAAGGFLGDVAVAVAPEIFLYAVAIAAGLAIVASAIPAWYVSRVKPAEVLRYE